ncbi:MAG: hypothetical protein CVV17_04375, partial [Gammaproteobacteria bacterium HGW-Gammaproteobacteria-7]
MNRPRTAPPALWGLMAGAACISTAAPLAAASGLPPSVSAFWRMAFGGAMLAVALLASGRWRTGGWQDWAWMSLPALAFAADLWLWHRSIVTVGPGLSTLLANFQVFVMALAGFVLFRERLGPRYLAGLGLAAGGLWLLLGRDWGGLSETYRGGVWFGLATALAYAVYLLSFRQVQRRHSSLPTIQLLAIASLLCAPMLGAAGLLEGRSFVIPTLSSLAALLARPRPVTHRLACNGRAGFVPRPESHGRPISVTPNPAAGLISGRHAAPQHGLAYPLPVTGNGAGHRIEECIIGLDLVPSGRNLPDQINVVIEIPK